MDLQSTDIGCQGLDTATDEKRILKLNSALDKLRRKENVQNRQLKTLLGDEAYARFIAL
jgi:hypothetical protein